MESKARSAKSEANTAVRLIRPAAFRVSMKEAFAASRSFPRLMPSAAAPQPIPRDTSTTRSACHPSDGGADLIK
eukprot:scaffold58722_cov31-Tisochrysis_lutea.AAC.3